MMGWLVLAIVVCLFFYECLMYGWEKALISSFWVFTLFYILSYPVKYLFIEVFNIEYQAPIKPDSDSLVSALVLSFLFWFVIYLFRRRPIFKINRQALFECEEKKTVKLFKLESVQLLMLGFIGVSMIAYYQLLEAGGFSFSMFYSGNSQNESRVGAGPYFLLYTLYLMAFFILLFFVRKKTPFFLYATIFFVIVNGFFEMVLLGTRRPLFLILYALVLWMFIHKRNLKYAVLLGFYPLFMSLLAPVGQVLRYSFAKLFTGEEYVFFSVHYTMVSIGSTFEGVEHLANFLKKLSVTQLLFGVDQGVAWLYNLGLSLVPRFVWEEKPLLYGSVAEQYFIYPQMYITGAGQMTLPPGIIVDSIYGFGVVVVFMMAFIYAKVFSILDTVLFNKVDKSGFLLLISAVLYIHIFNLVRGGTSVVMMIVILISIASVFHIFERRKRNFDEKVDNDCL